jgi:hypothetical protein
MKKQSVVRIGIKSNIKPNMKSNLYRIGTHAVLALVAASGLALLAGCAGHARAPEASGFLTHYCQLNRVDDLTWRYINTNRLSNFDRFRIGDVKVLATYFEGKSISDETKQKVEDYVRDAVRKALADRYSIVTAPAPDVADIRVAITAAYKTENHLGLTVEGEILDSQTSAQLAAGAQVDVSAQLGAVMRTELSQQYYSSYWDAPGTRELITEWASRLRKAIDAAHGHY